MAPKSKAQTSLLQAGASDSEDDLAGAENRRPNTTTTTAKANSRAKSKATMPRRTSGATKRKAAPRTTQHRQALKDRTNMQGGSDTEEVDNFDDGDDAPKKTKRAKTTTARKPAVKSKKELGVIPETQPDPEVLQDVEQSIEMDPDNMDVSIVPTPKQTQRFAQRPRSTSVQPLQARPSSRAASVQPLQPRASARSASAQPGYPPPRERSGSVSDTARERRGGDPELRRRLNDMTSKYENLNLKYQNLQETGKGNAESNFEKLKRASDQKAKDAESLIASLKKEIAELKKASSSSTKDDADNNALQKQISGLTTANSTLTCERDNLKSSLSVAQNEVKSRDAMLVAARQQLSNSTAAQEKSSANAKDNLSRSVGPGATDAQKEMKMKENLYSDLTGLIIRGVKRKEGEDEYDCIQTGRNGSKFAMRSPCHKSTSEILTCLLSVTALHFHLSIAHDSNSASSNPKTPSGLSYEEAEFAYEPLLDESRDRDLMELLPDYLTEEICFPRNHAVKFYSRVVDSMTKKILVEE